MRAEIDPRIADRGGDDEIKPAPPAEKEDAHRRDDHVIRHVPGGKRRAGLGVIGLIGNADRRFSEKREEGGAGPFQLDHPDRLRLFGPPAIDGALQGPNEQLFGDEQA